MLDSKSKYSREDFADFSFYQLSEKQAAFIIFLLDDMTGEDALYDLSWSDPKGPLFHQERCEAYFDWLKAGQSLREDYREALSLFSMYFFPNAPGQNSALSGQVRNINPALAVGITCPDREWEYHAYVGYHKSFDPKDLPLLLSQPFTMEDIVSRYANKGGSHPIFQLPQGLERPNIPAFELLLHASLA